MFTRCLSRPFLSPGEWTMAGCPTCVHGSLSQENPQWQMPFSYPVTYVRHGSLALEPSLAFPSANPKPTRCTNPTLGLPSRMLAQEKGPSRAREAGKRNCPRLAVRMRGAEVSRERAAYGTTVCVIVNCRAMQLGTRTVLGSTSREGLSHLRAVCNRKRCQV